MKAPLTSVASLLAVAACLSGMDDDRKPLAREVDLKKPTPRDQIKLTVVDWRPPAEIVFRAERSKEKHCREIGNSIACGWVSTLEIEEDLKGQVKMEALVDAHVSGTREGRAYNVRWKPSKEAQENLAMAAKGGYSKLWVSSERFEIVPEKADWEPSKVVVFSARYRRPQKHWGWMGKSSVTSNYTQFEVTSIHEGKLGVRRLLYLSAPTGLVDDETYTFKWKPTKWTLGELKNARLSGCNEHWMMFWEHLEVLKPSESRR